MTVETRDRDAVATAARAIERWGSERKWRGPDPYDALNASRLPRIARRSPLALRVVTQAVKRSPLNLRPLLGIPNGLSAATLAHVISAYARNGFLDPHEARVRLSECVAALAELRCATFPEPCWGYHFDVQTRVFFYPRTSPNTIATAFAGLGLIDAWEFAGARDALELATGAGEFFIRHVPQTHTGRGAYFGYQAVWWGAVPLASTSPWFAMVDGALSQTPLGTAYLGEVSALTTQGCPAVAAAPSTTTHAVAPKPKRARPHKTQKPAKRSHRRKRRRPVKPSHRDTWRRLPGRR